MFVFQCLVVPFFSCATSLVFSLPGYRNSEINHDRGVFYFFASSRLLRKATTTTGPANRSCFLSTRPSRRTAGRALTTTSSSLATLGWPWGVVVAASPSRSTTSWTLGRATPARPSAILACRPTSFSGEFGCFVLGKGMGRKRKGSVWYIQQLYRGLILILQRC